MSLCECGTRLYAGTEIGRGTCNRCRNTEPVALQPESSVTLAEVGSVTPDSVALPVVEGSVTKQEKYRAKNPDKTKADSAARVARFRQRKGQT